MFKKLFSSRVHGGFRSKYLVLAGALGLGLGLLIGFIAGRQTTSASGGLPWLGDTKTITGPWGEVRYWYSVLEMPSEMVAKWSAVTNRPTEWFIGLATVEDTGRMLDECGMSPQVTQALLSSAVEGPDSGIWLRPSDSLVISIPPDVRARLYARLTQWPRNDTYGVSTRFAKEGKLEWMDKSGLPSEVIKLTQKLIYRQKGVEMFADYDIVLRTIPDNRTARRFLRIMCRQNSIMGVLVVRPEDDLDALASYWGRGGRKSDIRILLEAVRASANRREVPLSSLMPPFVRDHIYRYSNQSDPEAVNCHYTSMNFFSLHLDNSLIDFVACTERIDRDYVAVTNDFQLGDVVFMCNSDGAVVHSCTIVAGNLVFTKNGYDIAQPWTIRTLENLLLFYGVDGPLTIKVFRRRDMMLACP